MPSGYWSGLVEGFQGRRESEEERNYKRALESRQMADRVFEYLLSSRDPRMQELALSGLMSPLGKKKGLAGFLGEYESNPALSSIVTRMNEMVPDTSGAPQPPAAPGSAAMSTNQPVRAGSAPITMPPGPTTPAGPEPMPPGMDQPVPTGPPPLGAMAPQAGLIGPPPPPPESKWKRRGTGVPTAEEIAEANAAAQMTGRLRATTTALAGLGAPPEQQRSAVLGIAGAPQPAVTYGGVSGFAVKLPDGTTVPVSRDNRTGQMVLPDGSPVPPDAEFVRAGTSSVPRSAREPDANSPTGYSRVFYDTDTGQELYRVNDVYTPPPAYSGTTVVTEPGTGVAQRVPVLREGGVGAPIGDVPSQVPAQSQTDAQALVQIVDRLVAEGRRPGLPVRPGQRDQVTRQEAQRMGLPFTTYAEAVRASRSTPEVPQRERVSGAETDRRSMAERIRQRALRNRQAPAVAPPPAAPARGQ